MWEKIKAFFKDSEVLFWARLQSLLGVIALVLTYVQPEVLAPLLGGSNSQNFALFLVANGFATEYLRRRRDESMK